MIGEELTVTRSSDSSKIGMTGVVLMDTAKTLVLDSNGRKVRIEKAGNIFQIADSKRVVSEPDIAGRLEDRGKLGSR